MAVTRALIGKVALVTGGSRGIGESIAVALARAGADVAVNYLSRENAARNVQPKIEKSQRRCVLARADMIPVGRFGQVEEASDVVAMLARNGYITGQTIYVNGGWYMS